MAVKHRFLKKVLYSVFSVLEETSKKISGPTKEDNFIWINKTKKKLDELIKQWNLINYVKSLRLSWFVHINRMTETCVEKKIYKLKPLTSRPVGNPKFQKDVRN
jgi:hypothetical protein